MPSLFKEPWYLQDTARVPSEYRDGATTWNSTLQSCDKSTFDVNMPGFIASLYVFGYSCFKTPVFLIFFLTQCVVRASSRQPRLVLDQLRNTILDYGQDFIAFGRDSTSTLLLATNLATTFSSIQFETCLLVRPFGCCGHEKSRDMGMVVSDN